MSVAEFHCEQQRPNSCVAACICMVLRWRGQSASEEELHQNACFKGQSLAYAALKLGAKHCAGSLGQIKFWLASERLLIVKVSGPPLVKISAPLGISCHGELCPPGDWGGPFHAVVFIASVDQNLLYLDPWFPKNNQPREISEDNFERVFSGELIVAERSV